MVSVSGMTDLVYNDFYVADGADVDIVAGCGIHNSGCNDSRHDGIHTFHVGKNANVHYEEKHYGEGNGTGSRVLNPVTNIELGENSVLRWIPFRSKVLIPQSVPQMCQWMQIPSCLFWNV